MKLAADVAAGLVALLHLWFLVLEMFLWNTPYGRRTFGLSPEYAAASKTLAANQGLYNGFLAAGLAWSLFPVVGASAIRMFFLGCVIVAGMYGGLTVSRKIYAVQAAPGIVALALFLLA